MCPDGISFAFICLKSKKGVYMSEQGIGNYVEMRRRPRKSCSFVPVNYSAQNRIFYETIKDISESGVAIESHSPLLVGDKITMTFLEDYKLGPVKISGDVVRSWMRGFAVHFSGPSPKQELIINSYIENIYKKENG